MARCKDVRPLLYRIAEGEALPREAILVARHIVDCTGCGILAARERRLAEMLVHGLSDRLAVGDEFVDTVMKTLPAELPRRRRMRARGLRLAVLAGAGWLVPEILWRASLPSLPNPNFSLTAPPLDPESGSRALDLLSGLGALAQVVAESLMTIAPLMPEPGHLLPWLLAAIAVPALAMLSVGSACLAVAARTLLRMG